MADVFLGDGGGSVQLQLETELVKWRLTGGEWGAE
jgi:hypothetical protein